MGIVHCLELDLRNVWLESCKPVHIIPRIGWIAQLGWTFAILSGMLPWLLCVVLGSWPAVAKSMSVNQALWLSGAFMQQKAMFTNLV